MSSKRNLDAARSIPVVDFGAMSLGNKDLTSGDETAVKELIQQMLLAFSTVGFVYITRHGMSQETIDAAFQVADKFFSLNTELKEKYSKSAGETPNGWDALERESPNPERPGDLKESYDLRDFIECDYPWPDAVAPGFKNHVMKFQQQAHQLCLRVLTAIAMGLGLDPLTFHYAFEHTGTRQGGTQIRFNYYPQIKDTRQIKVGQIRCGEHTDYGALTLLFQDECGGLEVVTSDGKIIPATPIEGSIVVNVADIMQRWTADKLVSARHRVVVQEKELHYAHPRRSIAYFLRADREALVECLDGSAKYPPITGGQHVWQKLHSTYNF